MKKKMIEDFTQEITGSAPTSESDEVLGFDVLAAKLRNYGKDNFPELNFNPTSHLDVIREGSALHSLNLPKMYAEQLITLESGKYFLFSDSPVIFRLEEALPSLKKSKTSFSENYMDIKKFYEKWSIEKNPKEMEFFALSTLNLFERNSNKENFLKYLYPACIHIYDKKFLSIAKAVDLLATAEKICQSSSLPEELKVEFSYLVCLYKGFAYMMVEDYEQASLHFNEAAGIKSSGNSALFQICITSMLIPGTEKPSGLLSTIVNYDIKRLMFALELNNLNLFIFFLKTAISYNLFKAPALAPLLPEIRILFESASENSKHGYQRLYAMVGNFTNLPNKEQIPDKLSTEVKFLLNFLDNYKNSRNQFVILLHDTVVLKYSMILQQIRQNIKNSIFSKKLVDLEAFDHQMRDENKRIARLSEDSELNKSILKKKQAETIEETETKYNDTLMAIENKIGSIETSPDFDPAQTFNNIMVYNVIISIALFIIGGFIGTFSGMSQSHDMNIFGSLIISGVKWGGFVFLGGLVIAFFSSASKIVERTNEKHRLQKRLTAIKNQKERSLDRMNKDTEKKIAAIDEVYKTRLAELHKRIEELKDEKSRHEVELKKEAQNDADEALALFEKVLNDGVPPAP